MYTEYTYQDWEKTPEGERLNTLGKIIGGYRQSPEFKQALDAMAYFEGRNIGVANKVILQSRQYTTQDESGIAKAVTIKEPVVGAQIPSNFLFRFVTQQNQYLLSNGVTLKDQKQKNKLGPGFDKAMESMGEKALLQGVCWAFYNVDHVEIIQAARDALSGFVALVDEETGLPRLGVQFWQIDAERPLYVRLFEVDGVTVYRSGEKELELHREKQAYKRMVAKDAAGTVAETGENWGALPLVPLYANEEQRSEMTPSIRTKIDAYDRIMSDFSDNFDKANDIYWVLNNFGGSISEMAKLVDMVRDLGVIANRTDGMGGNATAEPHTFEVPYEARKTALELLEKALYSDYMAMSMDEITGGSLTNVAIQTAKANMDLKANRYEWQCFQFVQRLLRLLGEETEDIKFRRQTIANVSETVADIYTMREDISRRKALELNPLIQQDEIDQIMNELDEENMTGRTTREDAGADEDGAYEDVNADEA